MRRWLIGVVVVSFGCGPESAPDAYLPDASSRTFDRGSPATDPAIGAEINEGGPPARSGGAIRQGLEDVAAIACRCNTITGCYDCPDGTTCDLRQECVKPRFEVNAELGIVTDNTTGLVWQREVPANQCPDGFGGFCSFPEAKFYCHHLQSGPLPYAWRLPSLQELFSLVETGTNPAIDEAAFPIAPATPFAEDYWTSSDTEPESPWVVVFDMSGGGPKPHVAESAWGNNYPVRCVT